MLLPAENPVREPGPATILVVEDEVLIRMMLAEELRGAGYAVLEAADADEAVALLEAAPDVALVFTDIRMPGSMDGFGLLRWLRAHRPHAKVIVSSADSSHLQLPPTWHASVRKPYDIDALLRCVHELLDRNGAPATGEAPGAGDAPSAGDGDGAPLP